MSKALNPIFDLLLSKTTVKEILPKNSCQNLVTLYASQSLPSAVDVLSKANILSAPVFQDTDKEHKEPLLSDCLGFVDSLDIIAYILEVAPDPSRLSQDELKSLKIAGKVLSGTKLSEVVGMSKKDVLIKAFEGNTISTFTSMFGFGIHRALLYDKEKRVVGTFSQSDVIRFVKTRLDQEKEKTKDADNVFLPMVSKPVSSMGYKSTPVITVTHDATVVQALAIMVQNRLSAIAVVHKDTGALFAEFTASQFRGLASEQFPDFLLTVEAYLAKHFPNQKTPPSVSSEITLNEMLTQLVTCQTHRCFMVDLKTSKPVAIVSLTDIMKILGNYSLEK